MSYIIGEYLDSKLVQGEYIDLDADDDIFYTIGKIDEKIQANPIVDSVNKLSIANDNFSFLHKKIERDDYTISNVKEVFYVNNIIKNKNSISSFNYEIMTKPTKRTSHRIETADEVSFEGKRKFKIKAANLNKLSMIVNKANNKKIIHNNHNFSIKSDYKPINSAAASEMSSIGNHYATTLGKIEERVNNISPINSAVCDRKQIEKVYENVKSDFKQLNTILKQDKNLRVELFRNLSKGNENKFSFYNNLYQLVSQEDKYVNLSLNKANSDYDPYYFPKIVTYNKSFSGQKYSMNYTPGKMRNNLTRNSPANMKNNSRYNESFDTKNKSRLTVPNKSLLDFDHGR